MARKVKKVVRKPQLSKPAYLTAPIFNPPKFHWALGAVFGLEFLLIVWAIMHHFIPSTDWQTIAFYLNIVVCIISITYFVYAFLLNKSKHASTLQRIFLALFGPVFIYCWGYLAFTYGAGDLITHLAGNPAAITDVLTKYADDEARFKQEYIANGVYEKRYFDNRKGCITRLTGPSLKNALPVYVCINGEEFAKLPKQVKVTMHGLKTYAGFDIKRIEYN